MILIECARVSGGSTNDIPRQCWRGRGECRMYIQSTPCQLKIKETASVRYPAYGHIQRVLHLPHQTGGQTMVCPPIWPPAMSRNWLNSPRFLNSALSGHPSRQKPLLRLPRLAHKDTARRCSANCLAPQCFLSGRLCRPRQSGQDKTEQDWTMEGADGFRI